MARNTGEQLEVVHGFVVAVGLPIPKRVATGDPCHPAKPGTGPPGQQGQWGRVHERVIQLGRYPGSDAQFPSAVQAKWRSRRG